MRPTRRRPRSARMTRPSCSSHARHKLRHRGQYYFQLSGPIVASRLTHRRRPVFCHRPILTQQISSRKFDQIPPGSLRHVTSRHSFWHRKSRDVTRQVEFGLNAASSSYRRTFSRQGEKSPIIRQARTIVYALFIRRTMYDAELLCGGSLLIMTTTSFRK